MSIANVINRGANRIVISDVELNLSHAVVLDTFAVRVVEISLACVNCHAARRQMMRDTCADSAISASNKCNSHELGPL